MTAEWNKQWNGNQSFSINITVSGSFLIRGMEDGTYQILVQGIREGETQLSETTLQNVVVVEGQIKSVGSIQL